MKPVRDLDWDWAKAEPLLTGVVDIWREYLLRLRDLPVARRASQHDVEKALGRELSLEPMDPRAMLELLRTLVFENATYTGHPRFMAYITGSGTIPGAIADFLASAINQNVGGWRLGPGATEIELKVMSWFATNFGLPSTAGGILASGGAMANFIALKAARDSKAGYDIAVSGVRPGLRVYASSEAHSVIERGLDMLGMGKSALRSIPVDRHFRMDISALVEQIERDIAAGEKPIAVAGTAGTVATGSIDPLVEIADVCQKYDLWMHVDGAYGGVAALVPELKPLFAGIERADSIAFDPHKWLYVPHSCGALVVRDKSTLQESFTSRPSYVHEDKKLTKRGVDLSSMGPQFSRGFQALKVWMSLQAHGISAYHRRIAHDVELARHLHDQIEARADFQNIGKPTLSIACFRYVPADLRSGPKRKGYLNALNERLMAELQLDGRVYPSNAVLNGRFCLRACIVNFRTEAEDLDMLLDVASELGSALDQEMRPEELR